MRIRIASRASKLALTQTNIVKQKLLSLDSSLEIEIVSMTTEGDRKLDISLAKIGGKGLFLKELETALIEKHADIAVHSMKDVPVQMSDALQITAVLKREDYRDALLSEKYQSLDQIPAGAIVGTSSLRRQCQLLALRPDIKVNTLRGNVETRIQKLKDGFYDAIILAAAGLKRLKLENQVKQYFSEADMLPAIGQGAIGVETRASDDVINALINKLNDTTSAQCLLAERSVGRYLNASCHWPLAALANIVDEQTLTLTALVGSPDGSRILRASQAGSIEEAELLGIEVSKELVAQGAKEILEGL